MQLSKPQIRYLRSLGHRLKPVVRVGQHGLRDSVIAEVDGALTAHELIKAKLSTDRELRQHLIDEICRETEAQPVHQIGQVVVLYRRNPKKPKIALPSR